MDQQTWVITFNGNSGDRSDQANTLEEFLLDASSDIQVVQKPANEYAQGGFTYLLVTFITSGAAVALINAISAWIKSTHGANIDIEMKEMHVKVGGVTESNCKEALSTMLKHIQSSEERKNDGK